MKNIIKKILSIIETCINFYIIKTRNIKCKADIVNFNGILKVVNQGKFIIDEGVRINSKYKANPIGGQMFSSFFIRNNAVLHIGKNSAMSNVAIVCWQQIIIGENVYIGGDCKIYDSDFHSIHFEQRNQTHDPGVKIKQIHIGDNVFIGASVMILKGVEIGENSVIGAGSVVSKNIPPNEIWAGNPIKKIRDL